MKINVDALKEGIAASPEPRKAASASVSMKVAGSAATLVVRRVVVMGLSFVSTSILARTFGVADFGAYNAGLAVYYLLLSAGDFGFGMVLARELGRGRANDGGLVRAMLQVQGLWSLLLGAVAVVFSLVVGTGTIRGAVVLVLVPAIATQALGGVRQVFYARYQTKRLSVVDVSTNAAQAGLVVACALLGADPRTIATVVSLMIVVNAALIFRAGLGMLDAGRPDGSLRWRLLRESLPLGLGSVLASAYFMLDLVIIGFLVDTEQIGYYSAALKILSILVTLPGLVITAALAGISATADDTEALGALVARLWHWLAALALPACLGAILFAAPLIELAYGSSFDDAVPLVRVVAASGAIGLLSNVLGTAMVAQRRTVWIVSQNAVALVANLVGNLFLVPRFGVAASAWLTLATEVFVCGGSACGLRGRMAVRPLLRVTRSPAAAALSMVVVSLALAAWVWFAIPAACVTFFFVLGVTRGWPSELRRRPAAGRSQAAA